MVATTKRGSIPLIMSNGEFYWNGHAPDYRNGPGCCTTCGAYCWSMDFTCLRCNPPVSISSEELKKAEDKAKREAARMRKLEKSYSKNAVQIRLYREAMNEEGT